MKAVSVEERKVKLNKQYKNKRVLKESKKVRTKNLEKKIWDYLLVIYAFVLNIELFVELPYKKETTLTIKTFKVLGKI